MIGIETTQQFAMFLVAGTVSFVALMALIEKVRGK